MKKTIIFIASAVALVALSATAAILFRRRKGKRPMTFDELYEDNLPSECPACGGERCCDFAERINEEMSLSNIDVSRDEHGDWRFNFDGGTK